MTPLSIPEDSSDDEDALPLSCLAEKLLATRSDDHSECTINLDEILLATSRHKHSGCTINVDERLPAIGRVKHSGRTINVDESLVATVRHKHSGYTINVDAEAADISLMADTVDLVTPPRRSKAKRRFHMESPCTSVRLTKHRRRCFQAEGTQEVSPMATMSAYSTAAAISASAIADEGLHLHSYMQARSCEFLQRDRVRQLFFQHGWPRVSDGATREYISELLGLGYTQHGTKHRMKAVTYLGWASHGDPSSLPVAAAILSAYKYRGKRRCGCLEFIVSKHKGAGYRLLRSAICFLRSQHITHLFSGADLSRPQSLAAHLRWGFTPIEKDAWANAGLASYEQGDVNYMVLDLCRLDVKREH
eukprot:TRINITY_DN79515_c0_g1_i1.p1 TRINITY_DN79515_c0_g1~~TRINITY_DN79515_c0_g1_i1.p1  ORF type:complete len:362 (-),score=42.76 TRINITY_DN79515_c0_g1_i1:48-1133(-)